MGAVRGQPAPAPRPDLPSQIVKALSMLDVVALSMALAVGQNGGITVSSPPDLPRNVTVPQVVVPSAPARMVPVPQRSVISVDPMPTTVARQDNPKPMPPEG